jgi:hypothetical protein
MVGIERTAIEPYDRIVAALLNALFCTGMAVIAEALQFAKDETIRVVVVRNNVIGARGGRPSTDRRREA